jgi:hypothetical protein
MTDSVHRIADVVSMADDGTHTQQQRVPDGRIQ